MNLTILKQLYRGSISNVYMGESDSGLRVAVKVLHLQENPDAMDREAKVLKRFRSPHVANLIQSIVDDDYRINVLEFVDGKTLGTLVSEEGSIPPLKVSAIALLLADALRELHQSGVVHGDLTPNNVMLTQSGQLKLIDFGASSFSDAGHPDLSVSMRRANSRQHPVGDVLGFGLLAMFLLLGRLPHFEDSLNLPLADPGEFTEIIRRCVALNPFERIQDGAMLYQELDALDLLRFVRSA